METDLISSVKSLEDAHEGIIDLYPLTSANAQEGSLETFRGVGAVLGMESQETSLEGFLDYLGRKAKQFSEVAWDSFIDSLDSSRSQAENKLNRIKYLRTKMQSNPNLGGKGKVPYQSQYVKLQMRGKITDVRTLLAGVDNFSKLTRLELDEEMDFVLRIASKVTPELMSLADTATRNPGEAVMSEYLTRIGEMGNLANKRRNDLTYLQRTMDENGKTTYQSSELPGNAYISSTVEHYDEKALRARGLPQFGAVSAIYNMRTILKFRQDGPIVSEGLPKMSELEMIQALNLCEDICNSIIRFKIRYGDNFSRSKREFARLRDRLDMAGRGGENIEYKIYLRKAADASHGTSRWIHTPAMPIVGHALRVTTALMAYVNASIDIR